MGLANVKNICKILKGRGWGMRLPSITLELVAVLGSQAEWPAKISNFTMQSAFSSHTSKHKSFGLPKCVTINRLRVCYAVERGRVISLTTLNSDPGKLMQRLRIILLSFLCTAMKNTWMKYMCIYEAKSKEVNCGRISDLKSHARCISEQSRISRQASSVYSPTGVPDSRMANAPHSPFQSYTAHINI